jgi:cytoskeletal protein CcmA (bactofilin family)
LVIVGEHMRFVGTIEGDEDLVVRGRVEGTVRISGTLTVEPGGLVSGAVTARAVAVVPGAVFRGQIEIAEPAGIPAAPPAPVPVAPPIERRALPRDGSAPTERARRTVPRLAAPARGPLRRRPGP